jgi:spermidine synthase
MTASLKKDRKPEENLRLENQGHWKILVMVTYFSLGAFALISQTMLLREFFVVVYGNELIFGILLTNWLAGIFIGALCGAAASEKSQNRLRLFVVSILLMAVFLPLAITLTRFLYIISSTPAGTYIGFIKVFLFSAIFILPISFFIGFVFPVAAKIQTLIPMKTGVPPGRDISKTLTIKGISAIYIFEAAGSLLSGIVYTFLLAGNCNAYFISALMLLPLLACAAALLLKSRRYLILIAAGLLTVFNLASLLPPVNHKFDEVTTAKRWQSISTLPLLYSTDSKYQNIAVSHLFNQYNLYLNTMLAAVFPNDEDNLVLAAHLVCQHPSPQRILIVGDALSGLAKALLRYKLKVIIAVEIDAQAAATTLKFLPPADKQILNDPRFKLLIRDGRTYIKDLARFNRQARSVDTPDPSRFDLVYLDIPEPSTLLLNRYYTREFFSDLSRIMSDNGVVAFKITSSENYEKGFVSDYTTSVYHTVKAVFPEVVVAPRPQNFIFASRQHDSVSDDPELLAQRYHATGVKPEKLGFLFQSLYPAEKTRFIENALETSRKFKINTDETPIATLYYNKIIGWYSESNLSAVLALVEHIKWEILMAVLLAFLGVRLAYVRWAMHNKTSPQRNLLKVHTLLAVFSGGLAGLSLELVILYTFQHFFGSIYYIIGFIIAVFMFGLPLGAVVSNTLMAKTRWSSDGRVIRLLIFVQITLGGISFLLPYLTPLFANFPLVHQIMIFTATILIGFLVGMVFPLSLSLYLGKQEKTGKAAGFIDAFDHMGAAAGAFFIGTLLLPVLGIVRVCVLVSAFPLISALLLYTDVRGIRRT